MKTERYKVEVNEVINMHKRTRDLVMGALEIALDNTCTCLAWMDPVHDTEEMDMLRGVVKEYEALLTIMNKIG